jgi:hypothetical protein
VQSSLSRLAGGRLGAPSARMPDLNITFFSMACDGMQTKLCKLTIALLSKLAIIAK